MVSLKTTFRSRFADAVECGDVISVFRDGSELVEVYTQPVRVKNLVGERRHVILRVRLCGTEVEGQLILAPSNVVYVRTVED